MLRELILNVHVLKSKNIFFTNDVYNEPQFLLQSKNFSAEILNSKLSLISRNTWAILDNKFKIANRKKNFLIEIQFLNGA